jgi:hypothetical protein
VGDGNDDQDDEDSSQGLSDGYGWNLNPFPGAALCHVLSPCALISGTERGLHWTRILDRPCARSAGEGPWTRS